MNEPNCSKLLLNAPFALAPVDRARLQAVAPRLSIQETWAAADALDGKDVAVLLTETVPRDLSRWPALRWVQLVSAGANQLENHPIQETDIIVTTASGTHGVPIAQYVVCTWLMMVHRMPEVLSFNAHRTWPNRLSLAASSVRGLTAGIVGYGSIGRECARLLAAFGMRILCLKRDPKSQRDTGYNAWAGTGDPEGTIPETWYGPGQLREMLSQCDLVIVTAPRTPETIGMIGEAEFRSMKPSVRMIVVSRGGIVSETALAEALRAQRIADAVVDCFEQEPLPPDSPLFGVPNLILTPHISGVYENFWPRMVDLLHENLRRFVAGTALLNEASRRHGY